MELPSVPTDGQSGENNSQGNRKDKLNRLLHVQVSSKFFISFINLSQITKLTFRF